MTTPLQNALMLLHRYCPYHFDEHDAVERAIEAQTELNAECIRRLEKLKPIEVTERN